MKTTQQHTVPNVLLVTESNWKRMLNQTQTSAMRRDVIRIAIALGVAVMEIEEYLTFLETVARR